MGDYRWEHAALTDVGRVRTVNEDAVLAAPGAGLFAIADGLGGHAAGEVASRIAIECLAERLGTVLAGRRDEAGSPPAPDGPEMNTRARLRDALEEGHRRILARAAAEPALTGMGTTATALLLLPVEEFLIGHIGDSRAYLLHAGELRRLTRDHSWVQEQVERGQLAPEDASRHPRANVLTRAIGIPEDTGEPDLYAGGLEAGDLFLLTSDGLTTMLPDARIAEVLAEWGPDSAAGVLEDTARRLVAEANRVGGNDNISVLLVGILSGP